MKNLFRLIFDWFLSLFKKKVKVEPVKKPILKETEPKKKKEKSFSIGFRARVQHNNRRTTDGRKRQIIKVGNTTKTIYHDPK